MTTRTVPPITLNNGLEMPALGLGVCLVTSWTASALRAVLGAPAYIRPEVLMAVGYPAVLIADALADGIRTVAKVKDARPGNAYSVASELGMPPWKVRKAQGQSRGWNPDGLATAMRVVARLNAEVKGVAADPGYALERAVLEVAAAKGDR